jgi:hypothetical protein
MAMEWNDGFAQEVTAAAMVGVSAWILLVEQRAVQLIMEPPKTGKIYRRRSVEHQASAPGEAPANWTGRLVNSRRVEFFEDEIRARLIFSTEYALPLEMGTRKMAPRPFARRALAETKDAGMAVFRNEIAQVLK